MISDGLRHHRIYNSLRLRMMLMMSLALLPIGLIAVTQTASVANSARQSAQLSLTLMTEQAAFKERLVIEQAMATSRVLSNQADSYLQNPATCYDRLRAVVDGNPRFSNAAIIPLDGVTNCSSEIGQYDHSSSSSFQDLATSGRPAIAVNAETSDDGTSVLIVSNPYTFDDEIAGIATVSIPHSAFNLPEEEFARKGLINLITIRRDGRVMTASSGILDYTVDMPRDFAQRRYLDGSGNTFYADSSDGRNLLYAVVPIRGSSLFVLGVWSPDAEINTHLVDGVPPGVFPALMWLISLAVALFAVHRLVTRHIRLLGRQMAHFAANRRAVKAVSAAEMPTELRDMQDSFLQMAEAILQDEAKLEDSVREKNVLLKEIHHRVKNNLQLISSIVNMQIRTTPEPQTKAMLRRIQDRVLSLATIHRDLYQSSTSGCVNVGALVKEVVEKSVDIGVESAVDIDLTTDISDVHLYPDQAVPLSLLAAEAATNAMKYMGARGGAQPYLTASLTSDNDGRCDFVVENSVGSATGAESTGLGAQLIKAFAMQLGATMDIDHTDDLYRLTVSFDIVDFIQDTADY